MVATFCELWSSIEWLNDPRFVVGGISRERSFIFRLVVERYGSVFGGGRVLLTGLQLHGDCVNASLYL